MWGYPQSSRFEHIPSIIAQLAISFANVLKLFSMSSSFESLESRESCVLNEHGVINPIAQTAPTTHLKLAYSAGTKHPHIPMIVNSPTCLRYVLFPTVLTSDTRGATLNFTMRL